MAFNETLKAIAAEEKLLALTDENYRKAREEWSDIDRRYAALRSGPSDGDGDALARIADLVRRHGPTAAKWLVGPAGGAAAAGLLADDGAFTSIIGKIGQLFGG